MFYSLAQVHYKRADNVTSVKFSNINLFKINCTKFGRIRYLHNVFTVKNWFNVTPFLWPLINRLFSFNNVISISKRCATQKIFFEYSNHSGHLVWINTHIPNKKNLYYSRKRKTKYYVNDTSSLRCTTLRISDGYDTQTSLKTARVNY